MCTPQVSCLLSFSSPLHCLERCVKSFKMRGIEASHGRAWCSISCQNWMGLEVSLFCCAAGILAALTYRDLSLEGNYVSYSVADHYNEESEEEAQPPRKKAAAKKPAAKNPPAKKAAASAKAKRRPAAEEENGADEDDDEAFDEDEDEKPKKKRKRATGATGGGSALSPEMQEFLGVERMARPQV